MFIVSALNIHGDEASVGLAATVIKTALLGERDAADIGMAKVPLGRLHADAPAALLARLGAQVRLGARAAGIERLAGGGFRVALSPASWRGRLQARAVSEPVASLGPTGSRSIADVVVLAVPADQAARLAAAAGVGQAAAWPGLGYSPILNAHVVYDRRVTDLPFAAAVDSPVQWVFDKTSQAGVTSGQYLAVSISAADELIDVPTAELRQLFVPALEQLFPAAASAGIRDFFITRERRATFRQAPGSGALRPGAATSVPGLALAGAWTSTGWPDTMEGAVRSGQQAAHELVRELAGLPTASRAAELDNAWSGAS